MENQSPLNENENARVKAAIDKIVNTLNNQKMIHNDRLEEEMGKPNKIENFVEGKFQFEKKTWLKDGEEMMVVVNILDEGEAVTPKEKRLKAFEYFIRELSTEELKKLLVDAENSEDYDCAIIIRNETYRRKGEIFKPYPSL